MILGTPGVSLNLGIPMWLQLTIAAGLVLLYIAAKKFYHWYKHRNDEPEDLEVLHDQE
ncbi:hypothetical protein GYB22_12810 [bacterium]|nr:hypothetical protein [bacterium]